MTKGDQWLAWVNAAASPVARARRRLIFQYIVMSHYTYTWISFEKALDFVNKLEVAPIVVGPTESARRIKDATAYCAACGWKASEIRRQ